MRHIFWLRPKLIAGRSGPDKDPWLATELASAGIGRVLSVNDGRLVHADDFAAVGIDYACMPLSDNAPPRRGDLEHCLETLPLALDYIMDAIEADKIPMIHCTSGKDRTGLLMCYYLCRHEAYTPRESVVELRRVRPIGLSAEDYEEFAVQVLTQLVLIQDDIDGFGES